MVAKEGVYNGMIDCLRKSIAKDGIGSLFSGIRPSLAGILPYAGTFMIMV